MLPNKLYDILKWAALLAFPGVAWWVGKVGPAWGWENVEAIVTTLNATGFLIGILIGVSTLNYNKKGDGVDE